MALDAVDSVVEQWARERPDVDVWPTTVISRIQRLSRLLDKELKAFFAQHDLEVWEFDVLSTLRRCGPPYERTAGAITSAAMVTSGAITNRVDRMEAKGLVERVRDTADRRTVRIRLTERGHALTDELIALHSANGERLLSALDRAEADRLAVSLRALLTAMGDKPLE
ncbi:MarR family transcriptional regulator [Streptomyces sp. AV19]|uniref:MarR family winged helix-turn-helix transcriptional regulator n=1 Tax=Streptomyces sp. AV19 TaxID=2793068 RepID=UPI0018FE2FAC|nr:MarR family transcriptional regulator [Streptomyces sp. AV19]MBH1937067.1 MarR family transcriptional regulator [Streptomyces sp. AV19]MDG4535906.1 MarR family transcriptional regulator [Streptomyces sp. AV19]